MPRKPKKTQPEAEQAFVEPAEPAKKPRRAAPTDVTGRGPTDPLTDAQRAQIWTLRAEQQSLRAIGQQVGCDARSVLRVLQEDPERYAALATEAKEERAQLWRSTENRSLRVLDATIAEAEEIVRRLRRPNSKVSKGDIEKVKVLRALMTPLRMAADSATSKAQLLTGQPTEIVGGPGGVLDPDRLTPDELVDMAIDAGVEDMLPAALRELARKRARDHKSE